MFLYDKRLFFFNYYESEAWILFGLVEYLFLNKTHWIMPLANQKLIEPFV